MNTIAAETRKMNPPGEAPGKLVATDEATTESIGKEERRKIDEHWRAIIKKFFLLVLRRILPELADDVDRSRKIVFLEKELEELTVYIDGPKQIPDILARVPTTSGRDVWLVLHVEIQGPGGGDLPERLFFYNSSLRVTYLKDYGDTSDAVSCAILTAKRPAAEEERYLRESYGNRMLYEYPTLKIWELDSDDLESSGNSFDWALYAGKCALESGRNDRVKLDYLKGLIEKLDSKGWTHDEKVALFRFMDALLHPKSPEMQKAYDEFREQRKKEGKIVLLSVVEERAQKRGEKMGKTKQKLAVASKMLDRGEPHEKILDYAEISRKQLDELIKARQN